MARSALRKLFRDAMEAVLKEGEDSEQLNIDEIKKESCSGELLIY